MTFEAFFHQNIFLFAVSIGLLVYLLVTEFMRGGAKHQLLSSAAFSRMINDGATLVDLRDESAYQRGHIVGAQNMTLEALLDKLASQAKDKPIALYCDSGRSSQVALGRLKKSGFNAVYHLQGGVRQWLLDGLPLEKK
ncbi:rhodanese-like domain-containing protein [Ostreibacterium oceani]|uniref:Rhodanese domain-containing protein n=1 Tax=Ostreibacterium oceani TaxID=2654998 RepID=A0A6N7ET66_9GAMM|nr:rhodanese-like domain-containing protein [Ostreibacterium oceani]MPV85632.1 hypothetical protein [Ostreibacterium oceani]